VDVDDVEYQPAGLAQRRRGRLRQEQRRLEIGAEQVIPGLWRDLSQGCGVESGGVVHQHIQRTPGASRKLHELGQSAEVQQVGLEDIHGARARLVEFRRQRLRVLGRVAVVDHEIRTRFV
jgi:hypothetical protein